MNLPDTYPLTKQEVSNSRRSVDYSTVQAIPEIWPIAAQRFGQVTALHAPHSQPVVKITYAELCQTIQQFAAGLQALEIKPGDHIALFSDNAPRWLIADQGIMTAGAVDAVRGSQADPEELLYILSHSDSIGLIVQDQALFDKLSDRLKGVSLRFIILLTNEHPQNSLATKLLNFSQLLDLGTKTPLQPVSFKRDSLATLMYTSGTSGKPKGVMLSHDNLLSQITAVCSVAHLTPGERVLSILPVWHVYERTFEYFILSQGCTQIYTSIRQVKKDLKDFQPYYMVGVPRLWESIYEGVRKQFREQPASKQKLIHFFLAQSQRYITAKRIWQRLNLENLEPSILARLWAGLQTVLLWPIHQLGGKLVYQKVQAATGGQIRFVVSGGGSIADHLEDFYEIIGVTILGGYGLTETSPITHVRRPWHNLRGSDGKPVPGTETRIVDLETRQPLPLGRQGLVLIRGPQVMLGYYKNPEATAKAIDSEGWFDTGDLGKVTGLDDLILTGRAKDTIVLTNGENIEPLPIENACIRSPYIDQIMLVGQDQRSLGALIVPNFDALQQWLSEQALHIQLPDQPQTEPPPTGFKLVTLEDSEIQALFRQELNREVKNRPGYRPDDRIGPFRLILEPFSIENGMMTQKLSIRRFIVTEHYRDIIDGMFF
ncbi:MAG: AMP-binding protein [Pseudanabaenales cyanobacterium]|nr:AMP-binding protein [Pseudanabaenales cyanobacterium]